MILAANATLNISIFRSQPETNEPEPVPPTGLYINCLMANLYFMVF